MIGRRIWSRFAARVADKDGPYIPADARPKRQNPADIARRRFPGDFLRPIAIDIAEARIYFLRDVLTYYMGEKVICMSKYLGVFSLRPADFWTPIASPGEKDKYRLLVDFSFAHVVSSPYIIYPFKIP